MTGEISQKNRDYRTLDGRWLVALAAILWSTSGFFAKAPSFGSWTGPSLAFWRAVFASLLLVPMVRRPKWGIGLIPMAFCFASMNYTYLNALVLGEASNAIWLQNTAPMWVFLIGVIFLRETSVRADWIFVTLAAIGIGFILFFELQGAAPAAVIYGLLSGVTYAGVVLSLRHLRAHDSAWLVALNHVVTAVCLLPLMVTNSQTTNWPVGMQWLMLAGFGMLQMGVPYVLFAQGLKTLPSHQGAGIGLLEPLLVPIWVFIAWGHTPEYTPPRWWTIVGGGCILVGLAYRFVAYPYFSRRSEKFI